MCHLLLSSGLASLGSAPGRRGGWGDSEAEARPARSNGCSHSTCLGPWSAAGISQALELCPLRQQARAASSRLVPTVFQGTLPGAGMGPPSSQGLSDC